MSDEQIEAFIKAIKKKKQFFKRKYQNIKEEDVLMRESITRKIELLNCLIAEFGGTRRYSSINNMKHRARF